MATGSSQVVVLEWRAQRGSAVWEEVGRAELATVRWRCRVTSDKCRAGWRQLGSRGQLRQRKERVVRRGTAAAGGSSLALCWQCWQCWQYSVWDEARCGRCERVAGGVWTYSGIYVMRKRKGRHTEAGKAGSGQAGQLGSGHADRRALRREGKVGVYYVKCDGLGEQAVYSHGQM